MDTADVDRGAAGAARVPAAEASGSAALGEPARPVHTPPGGRQRRAAGGRHRQVQVRVTDDERALLVEKAAAAGVSLPRFLLECALSPAGPTSPERRAWFSALLAARRDLWGAASNLNQLTRLGHIDERVPAEVGPAAEMVERTARVLAELLEEAPA